MTAYIGQAAPLQGAFQKMDDISSQFNGVTTVFNMQVSSVDKPVATATNLIVGFGDETVTDGYKQSLVILEPDVDYTVSGSIITFPTIVPASTDYCWIMVLGDVGNVVV